MSIWIIIAVVATGTIALKIVGPLVAGGRQPPGSLLGVIALVTPVLLASLVVASTLTDGPRVVVDARLAGLVVGGGLLLLRVPLVVAMVVAAAVTAALRAFI